MTRTAWCLLALVVTGLVAAHAHLSASSPERDGVLTDPPTEIRLEFSEALEVAFSVFRVYTLEATVDLAADDARQRLNGLAALLVGEVLGGADDDERSVPFTLEPASGLVETVVLTPEEEFAPGHYVVLWRILSADTHVVQDFLVFSVAE